MKPVCNEAVVFRIRESVVFLLVLVMGASCSSNMRIATVPPAAEVSADLIDASLILIGDAGGALRDDMVLRAATVRASVNPDRTLVVFLGDLIYPAGLPVVGERGRAEAERTLLEQMGVATNSGARGVMIPGNHDWGGGAQDGLERISRLQDFIVEESSGRISLLPLDGCPGPMLVDIGNTLRVIGLDTNWWLADVAELVPEGRCTIRDLEDVKDSILVLLAGAGDREVIVAAHHPLDSYGSHGGYFTLKHHIFPLTKIADWLWIPLPIVGSIYPLLRRSGVSNQDLSSKRYRRLRQDMAEVLSDFRPLAFAGGHEHSLQVLSGQVVRFNIVSGSGFYGHSEPVGWKNETLFAASRDGFVVVDFLTDGRIRLAVVGVGGGEVFSMWLE